MTDQQINMPIDRLSYSALTQLLRNPMIFKMKHILGVYEGKMGVSGMIGIAAHEALRAYYGGNADVALSADKLQARAEARDIGLKFLDTYNDAYIEYGKTGSRESMLKGYTQVMDFYFAEEPEYHEILMCEEKMTSEISTDAGDKLPLPATGKPDLVVKNKNGTIDIIDTKFVTGFTSHDEEDYVKIVQSQFMYHLLKDAKGIKADRMLFREVKRSKNNDGMPQVRDWAIPFNHEPYKIIFYNLYRDVVKFISNPDAVYLPNLSDPYDGEHAGLIYAQGLISADMSDVEVIHKVREVAMVSKKFVGSSLDSDLNKNLLPEEKIKVRLAEFGIPVEPESTIVGSSVTQYRFKVSAGIRMSTILKHKADIALALQAKGEVRILAPISGTSLIGVEVENESRTSIKLDHNFFIPNTLSLPIGVEIDGTPLYAALDEMPHLLIAGTTGSGKSVLLHSIITALTKQNSADQMKLILIDPKRVELKKFKTVPHIFENTGIIYEYEETVKVLMSLTDEMEVRYKILEKAGKRDIKEFNASKKKPENRMPYIVVVIDEFADLIRRAKIEENRKGTSYSSKSKPWLYKECMKRKISENKLGNHTKAEMIEALEEVDAHDDMKRADANVELLIVRLAQMARAIGIHLVIATQRPSVDVITGLIKANFPTRIALTTSSPADSIVILGQLGAEKLSGKGDMLFQSPALRELKRLQGYHL